MSWNCLHRYPHRHRHRHSYSHPYKYPNKRRPRRRILFLICVWMAVAVAFIAAEIKLKIGIGIGITSVDAMTMRISTRMTTRMRRIGMHSHPSYRVPIRGGVLSSFRGAQPQSQSQWQSQPPLSFSLLSVRRFASKDDIGLHGSTNNDSDDERDPPFLNNSPPNELSTLATSVRDRVTNLLSSTIPANHNHHRNHTAHILPIVIAVSGGCDSVALFHALMEWHTYTVNTRTCSGNHHLHHLHQQQEQLQLQLDITVVHFHHRQRPIDADEDCKLVRELVDKYNNNANNATANDANAIPSNGTPSVAFRLEDWRDRDTDKDKDKDTDTEERPPDSEATGSSFSQDKARVWRRTKLQECAEERVRTLRRQFQSSTIQDDNNDNYEDDDNDERVSTMVPFGMVLTAHHDDDSYETVLIKLLRGVHLLNLHDKATISSVSLMENHKYATGELQDAQQRQQQEEKESPTPSADTGPIYLVRPFVTDTTANLAGHTKDDLIQYLVHRNLPWREDASNHDPHSKYLRNRVRRDLIPLLRDLTQDSFRTKRIPALLEQSQQMAHDLEPRVEAYLASAVVRYNGDDDDDDDDNESSFFSIVPRQSSDNAGGSQDSTTGSSSTTTTNSNSSQLVRSQALYKWMSMRVQEESRKSSRDDNSKNSSSSSSSSLMSISYESLQRVVQQLEDYPERQQWTLELGAGWTVERVGDFLRMKRPIPAGSRRRIPSDSHRDQHSASNRVWGWTRVRDKDAASIRNDFGNHKDEDEDNKDNSNCLFIQVPSAVLEANANGECLEFVSTTLQQAETDREDSPTSGAASSSSPPSSLRFTPSWKTSRIKLRAFLRGQHVPVHLRDTTQLLFATYATTTNASEKQQQQQQRRRLVAVCIRNKWMVDREFHIAPVPAKDGSDESSRDKDSEAVILEISKRKE